MKRCFLKRLLVFSGQQSQTKVKVKTFATICPRQCVDEDRDLDREKVSDKEEAADRDYGLPGYQLGHL